MKKRILNKWQFDISIKKPLWHREMGWYEFNFGIFKFHSFPDEAMQIAKENYKGFMITFYFWLPFY